MMAGSSWWALPASVLVALLAHVLLGWEWTALGGLAAGLWSPVRAWLNGTLAGAFGWLALIAYNVVVARGPTEEMLRSMGAIFGGMPGWMLGTLTIGLGALLGLVGVWPGRVIRGAWQHSHS